MRWKLKTLMAGATLAMAAGCAGNHVATDYSPAAQFSHYRTFALVSRPDSASHQLIDQRVREAVEGHLAAKGLTETPRDQADILVGYGVVDHTRTEVSAEDWGWGPRWGWRAYRWGVPWPADSRADIDTYTDGTVVVWMIDRETHRVVWRSQDADVVTLPVSRPERADAQIDQAIGKMFDKFPPTETRTAHR